MKNTMNGKMEVLEDKIFSVNGKLSVATLEKEGGMFFVKVNDEIYKETPNIMFAKQVFNAI